MANDRPNIVVILTDQQRTDSLGCYGAGYTRTPNIDRLATEGVLLERAYCANPVCTPARASIFSGLYPSRHGAWNVGMNVSQDVPMLSHMLSKRGYRSHYVGKAHFQPFGGPPGRSVERIADDATYGDWTGPYYGFETVDLSLGHTTWGMTGGHYGAFLRSQVSDEQLERFRRPKALTECFGGEAYDWELPTRLHSSTWTAQRASAFIDGARGGGEPGLRQKPFLLVAGFQDPHHPHCVPTDFDDRVDPASVPLPDYVEGELADKPPHFAMAHEGRLGDSAYNGKYGVAGQGRGYDYRRVTEQQARLGRAYYHTMVRLIDRGVGEILAALDRTGLAENTLVIFTTDHGEMLGDHGIWMKGPFLYEQETHIPMIFRWPAGLPRGTRTDGLFSQVDIVPTVLSAVSGTPKSAWGCGSGGSAAIERPLDGHDALPMLRGQSASPRDAVMVECVDDPRTLRLKTIVTMDRKLTWYAGSDLGEMYDLAHDPGEKRNLWNDPACAADKARLLGRILSEMESVEPRSERYCHA